MHLFLCCAKSTLTGFDPKQGQLRTLRFLQPLAALPTPSTFNFNYVGTGPGPGAAARFSWPSLGGPVLWPRIFPKSLCRIARSLPILHFLFGQIPGCLTRVRLRLCPAPFLPVCRDLLSLQSHCLSQFYVNKDVLLLFRTRIIPPKITHTTQSSGKGCLFGELCSNTFHLLR